MMQNMQIHKKVFFDESGEPQEVIIPWAEFKQIEELLGLDDDSALSAEWEAEIEKRTADLDAGRVKPLSSKEVLAQLDALTRS